MFSFSKNFERQKKSLQNAKQNLSNVDADADINVDANVEMPMPKFQNGPPSVAQKV